MSDKPESIWAVFEPHKGGGHPIVFASAMKTKGDEYVHADLLWTEAEKRLQAEERLEALQAERDAADGLAEVTEACLRMMDDVLKGTGKGDMALKPDGSLGLIEGWKMLAAYKRARSKP